jgi:hypothetical protein
MAGLGGEPREKVMTELSSAGLELLGQLASGGRVTRTGGAWAIGAQIIKDDAVAELTKHDLLRRRGETLVISGPGESLLDRMKHPEQPNRVPAKRRRLERGTATKAASVNLAESPLSWLMRRRMITARQFEAGERLRADFLMAGSAPRTTMNWDGVGGGGTRGAPAQPSDPGAAQLSARQRFEQAAEAAGSGLTSVLWRVICMGEGLETTERALGWPARAGKVVLGLALDRLAEHYRLPEE